MSLFPQVFQFLVVAVAGWINQQQRDVIDYLQEENRVLREQLGPGRLRFTDAQRRRLAAKAKPSGDGYSVTCTPWSRPIPRTVQKLDRGVDGRSCITLLTDSSSSTSHRAPAVFKMETTRPPGVPGNPPARMPRAPPPARSPPPRPLRRGEMTFRPTHDVGPRTQCMSGLNHAAYGLHGRASLPHACGVRSWRWTAAHGIPTLSLALAHRWSPTRPAPSPRVP